MRVTRMAPVTASAVRVTPANGSSNRGVNRVSDHPHIATSRGFFFSFVFHVPTIAKHPTPVSVRARSNNIAFPLGNAMLFTAFTTPNDESIIVWKSSCVA